MVSYSADWLAKHCAGSWVQGSPVAPLTGFSIDSRDIRAGEIFVAIPTGQRDGHEYLDDAKDNLASAAIVSHPVDSSLPQLVVDDTVSALQFLAKTRRMESAGTVIGITGSCGKTSTKEILRLLLGEEAYATPKNLNNLLGVPLTILRWDEKEFPIAVIEAGISEFSEMAQLADMIRPQVGIITSIGASHLEGLGSIKNVALEKNRLLTQVCSGGLKLYPEEACQYLSIDEADETIVVVRRSESISRNHHVHYFFQPLKLTTSTTSLRLSISCRERRHTFDLPFMSEGMVRNVVFSIIVAQTLQVSDEQIQSRIAGWKPFEKRGEEIVQNEAVIYFDGYNANPLSLIDAVHFFRQKYMNQQRVYIIGQLAELGKEAAELHRKTGRELAFDEEEKVLLIGEELAKSFAIGIEESGASATIENDFSVLRSLIQEHRGAVFIKGSRNLKLENLLGKEATTC